MLENGTAHGFLNFLRALMVNLDFSLCHNH